MASFRSLKSLIDGIRLMESRLLEGLILIKDHASFFFKVDCILLFFCLLSALLGTVIVSLRLDKFLLKSESDLVWKILIPF